MALQEGAIGGVIDDTTPGAAPVELEQLRVIVAGLQQVPTLAIADFLERRPTLQEHRQVVCALAIRKAELITGIGIEEATQAPSTVEVHGGQPDVQKSHIRVLDGYHALGLHRCAVFVSMNLQPPRRMEKR